MRAYWKARNICHACHMTKSSYIQVPNPLPHLPRRDLDDFLQNAIHPGEKSTSDQHKEICDVLISNLELLKHFDTYLT